MTNVTQPIENPVIRIDKLIHQLDTILASYGIITILQLNTQARDSNSVVQSLVDAMHFPTLARLEMKYPQILEIIAEIIANIEEENCFSHLNPPVHPTLGHDNKENLKKFISYAAMVKTEIQPLIDDEVGSNKKNQLLAAIENKKKILDKGFFYEFTDGDLNRIQELINELRQEIVASDLFEEGHKRRLLRRLESMQSELHKKMSDVDRIWGLVGDAGIVIGKFGKDAKPFVDRIKELSQIAWKTQARAEELPSSSQNPLLGHDED